MTANELRNYFNNTFGIDNPWPKTFEVDAETYGNCCQAAFDWYISNYLYNMIPGIGYKINLTIGQNKGLMLKNIELILSNKVVVK